MDRFYRQPWLQSALSDGIFILLPPFFSLLMVLLFPAQFQEAEGIPPIYWLLLVVFIDVAHVYSTLYRTYFNPDNFRRQSALLIGIPLFCYIVGVLLYQFDDLWFWRILAYLAVYHFIRQQYGFMRLYSREEYLPVYVKCIDQITIYTAAVYPLLFWHLSSNRNFCWFVEGDFLLFKNERLLQLSGVVYILVIGTYFIKEFILIIIKKQVNIPRNLLVLGTFLSWYFGIVYFNGDMAFTTLNVISHGIPYMALIWFFERKKLCHKPGTMKGKLMKLSFGRYGVFYFLLTLVVFAYFEEGLWDGLVWGEHRALFSLFTRLPQISDHQFLSLLIPLLTLPQATHYVLDGFIWKSKHKF
ncbi:hypothetical protein SAMN05421820_105303 [Pedobacter steynii]|uniref:Uncharacterized protein n=1 Tax=Pedobacter steynii TaxID=430522 RepID=A0A1G9WWL6_9SPHI|nr:hypothetical protein [Pedobacter steynii]NQX40418.1 hypothetical protein [Pedobacter steynii]SDM88877.1 hypothetical protein SAMN05421820_105303 [Pedobacter steynii]